MTGIVGYLWGDSAIGTMTNCYSTCTVSGYLGIGGLVGINRGTITNCNSSSGVSGFCGIGGLAGRNWGGGNTLSSCYSTGDVEGGDEVGGLVGGNGGTITNCYSTGSVTGNIDVGGLVGYSSEFSRCFDSFWDIETSDQITSDGGTGLPTSLLQQQSTFTDWDFINVWNIGENQTYPYLRTVPAGDINHDRIVNLFDFAVIADRWMEEEQ